jgi:hypothetical protein
MPTKNLVVTRQSRREFLGTASSAVVASSFASQALAHSTSQADRQNSAWLEQLGQRIGLQAWNKVVPAGASNSVSLQFHAGSEYAGHALLLGLTRGLEFAQRSSGQSLASTDVQSNFSAQPHLLASAIVTNNTTAQSVLVEISTVALSYEQWSNQDYALDPSAGVYWMGLQ